MATTETFDAVIVGSGAAGGAAAHRLTAAGWKVCVLEKGPHRTEKDVFHDELAVCRREYAAPGVASEPNVEVKHGTPQRTARGWIACGVGGGTVYMSGFFFRMRARELADWPVDAREMAPFYDQVERTIGVSGDAAKLPEPQAPFPLGPIAVHPAARLVEEACARLGRHVFPTPRAILSEPYAGRPACAYCGFCGSYGCEIGAKSSSEVSFLRLAARTGNLTLVPDAPVVEVLAPGGRAGGVVWQDAQGARHEARGRVVVLAASAIQTARLLLLSGLANGSGQLGKNLMFATFAGASGTFALPHAAFPTGGREWPFLDRSVQDDDVPGTLIFIMPHVNPIHRAERLARRAGDEPPLWGVELARRLRRGFLDTRAIEVEAFSSFQPHAEAQVTLDPEVKDRRGLPVARFSAAVHPASLEASDRLAARGREILAAAGATVEESTEERTYALLQAGTARMGADASTSVIDASGRVHDVKNLYVADSSGFPSIGGAPFTETIMANALRVASRIVEAGARGEL